MFYPNLGIETARAQVIISLLAQQSSLYNKENDSYALWDFYGKATPPPQRDYKMEDLDGINLNEFYRATYPDFLIISCKYKRGTCRDQWDTELTMYGRCKSFVDDHGTTDVDDGISDATFRTLQLVLAYNTSD